MKHKKKAALCAAFWIAFLRSGNATRGLVLVSSCVVGQNATLHAVVTERNHTEAAVSQRFQAAMAQRARAAAV